VNAIETRSGQATAVETDVSASADGIDDTGGLPPELDGAGVIAGSGNRACSHLL